MGYTRVGDYLVGLIGLALLRSRVTGAGNRAFSDTLIEELRRILEHWDDAALQEEQYWQDAPAAQGYALWASTYDTEYNPLIALDNAVLQPILDRYPPGYALDAACGTGRWAAYLQKHGHVVRGVDQSPEMLAVARSRLRQVELARADLDALPLLDASVDLVVCSLALTHLPELAPAFSEFARVLRPGGAAVISNIHHLALPLGGLIQMRTENGRPIQLPASQFLPTDYINAALSASFEIRSCAEVSAPDPPTGYGGPTAQAWCPQAVRAASIGTPALMVLEITKPGISRSFASH